MPCLLLRLLLPVQLHLRGAPRLFCGALGVVLDVARFATLKGRGSLPDVL